MGLLQRLSDAVATGRVLTSSGLAGPVRPDRALGMGLAVARWGVTPAAGYAAAAMRAPGRLAIVDDDGSLTYEEVDAMSNAAARALADMGVGEGDPVGVLARNSRWFIVAVVAIAKLGADTVYLNTGFAGPQLAEVLDSHGVCALVLDEEFVAGVRDWCESHPCVVALQGKDSKESSLQTLAGLA